MSRFTQRNSPFSGVFRILLIVFVVMTLLQGLPMFFKSALVDQRSAATRQQNNTSYYNDQSAAQPANRYDQTRVTEPQTQGGLMGGLMDIITPLAVLWMAIMLTRIWFLLEKISGRLERNKLDINLNLRRDDR